MITAKVENAYRSISKAAAGAVFLGCPFGGTPYAEIGDSITAVLGNAQGILQSLKPESPQLFALQDDFRKSYPELAVTCFFEKLKSNGAALVSRLKSSLNPHLHLQVVSEQSAKLAGMPSFAMHRDHRGMNNFSSRNDESYHQVLAVLKRMRHQALRRSTATASLQMEQRRTQQLLDPRSTRSQPPETQTSVEGTPDTHSRRKDQSHKKKTRRGQERHQQELSALPSVAELTLLEHYPSAISPQAPHKRPRRNVSMYLRRSYDILERQGDVVREDSEQDEQVASPETEVRSSPLPPERQRVPEGHDASSDDAFFDANDTWCDLPEVCPPLPIEAAAAENPQSTSSCQRQGIDDYYRLRIR